MFIEAIQNIANRILKQRRRGYLERLVRNGLVLGKNVAIIDTFFFDPSHCFLITIEDNCTICPNVRLIAHDASIKSHLGCTKIGRIAIRENCFIGDSTIVLPGVTIGPNTIVGAGSVVTKSLPANVVAAGNPAKVISSLSAYLKKIAAIRDTKKVFGTDYFIENLNKSKEDEIKASIDDSIGFIL